MDFTPITAVLNTTTIIAAIGAVAAIKVLPAFTRWGYGQVTKMLGR